jgi:hypothetical protein
MLLAREMYFFKNIWKPLMQRTVYSKPYGLKTIASSISHIDM